MQITGLMDGNNINHDYHLSALSDALLSDSCVISGLAVSAGKVAAGRAIIKCTRTNGQVFYATFDNTAEVDIDTTGTKKVFIAISQAKVDDGTTNNEDGTAIATIQTSASYPSANFVKLASIVSDAITDERQFVKLKSFENGGLQKGAKSSDIASASTIDLSSMTGNYAHVTGTTTITSLGNNVTAGTQITLVFDDVLTLTHNGTSLKLPTAANIATQAGDSAIFKSEGSGNWKCISYLRADGTAIGISIPLIASTQKQLIAGEALTKGDAAFIECFVDASIIEGKGSDQTATQKSTDNSTDALTGWYGVRFTVNTVLKWKGYTKSSNTASDLTSWRLLGGSGEVLDTGTPSGGNGTATKTVILYPGITYRIEVYRTSGSWSYGYSNNVYFPVNTTYVNFVRGSYNGADYTASYVWIIANMTVALYPTLNVGDLTANTRRSFSFYGSGNSGSTMDIYMGKVGTPLNLNVRIETDNAGNPSGTLANANATASIAHGSITTAGGKITVTFGGSFTLTRGTKYHVVLNQGTYGSETINASNYYQLIASSDSTTTQFHRLYGGSSWSSVSAKTYIDSALAEKYTLEKTNATYSHRSYFDGIVEATASAGSLAKISTRGTSYALSGLTPRAKYYLANGEGTIATTAGTNTKIVGTASTAESIEVRDWD